MSHLKSYKYLCNFTGGLDSTYVLWTHLKNNPRDLILVHHCNIKTHQNRYPFEKTAVDNILIELRAMGLTNFSYIETTFDYGNMHFMVNDIEVIGFMTAALIRNHKYQCNDVLINASKEDLTQASYPIRAASRFEVIKHVARREPNYHYPIKDLSRKEMLAQLPENLKKHLWFCRRPVNNKPCTHCIPCLQTLRYL